MFDYCVCFSVVYVFGLNNGWVCCLGFGLNGFVRGLRGCCVSCWYFVIVCGFGYCLVFVCRFVIFILCLGVLICFTVCFIGLIVLCFVVFSFVFVLLVLMVWMFFVVLLFWIWFVFAVVLSCNLHWLICVVCLFLVLGFVFWFDDFYSTVSCWFWWLVCAFNFGLIVYWFVSWVVFALGLGGFDLICLCCGLFDGC